MAGPIASVALPPMPCTLLPALPAPATADPSDARFPGETVAAVGTRAVTTAKRATLRFGDEPDNHSARINDVGISPRVVVARPQEQATRISCRRISKSMPAAMIAAVLSTRSGVAALVT